MLMHWPENMWNVTFEECFYLHLDCTFKYMLKLKLKIKNLFDF